MVLLTTTPLIHRTIHSLDNTHSLAALPDDLPRPDSPSIDHKTLITLSRLPHTPSLHHLLKCMSVYHPPPPPPPQPTPQYLALKAALLAAQERRAYETLLSHHRSSSSPFLPLSSADADPAAPDPLTPSLIANIFLSTVLCGAGCFVLTSRHRLFRNDGWRVLVSLGVSLVVALAEVGLLMVYLARVAEARRRERGRVEVKREMSVGGRGSAVGGGGVGGVGGRGDEEKRTGTGMETEAADGERVEVWGRGVNGGVRRRVRERWEKENGSGDG